MRATRLRTLLLCAVLAGAVAYLLGAFAYGELPPLPRYAPLTMVVLGVAELAMARVVHDRVRGRARPGARPLHAMQVARAAALAKASSPAGALLLGAYVGLLVATLPKEAAQAGRDALVSGVSAAAALLLVGAALVLERACRTPDRDDDESGLGSRT